MLKLSSYIKYILYLMIFITENGNVSSQDEKVQSPFGCSFPRYYESYDEYPVDVYERLDRLSIDAIDIHPNGQRVAISSQLGVYIFDALTLQYQTTAQCSNFIVENPLVRWSPDGMMLAVFISRVDGIQILNADSYSPMYAIEPGYMLQSEPIYPQFIPQGNTYIADIEWSPDSSQLAVISDEANDNQSLRIWNIPTQSLALQSQMYRPYHRLHPVSRSIAWSPDGDYFACQCAIAESDKQSVYIWNAQTFIGYMTPPVEYASIEDDGFGYSIDWSAHDQLAFGTLVDEQTVLYLWNAPTRAGTLTPYRFFGAMDWHPTEDSLLIYTTQNEREPFYALLDTESQTMIQTFPADPSRFTSTLLWHPDGEHFYSIERVDPIEPQPNRLRLWRIGSEAPLLMFGWKNSGEP